MEVWPVTLVFNHSRATFNKLWNKSYVCQNTAKLCANVRI